MLTVGLITVCGLSVLFAYVSDSVQEYDGIALADRPIVAWLAAHREPVLITVMRTLSMVGSPVSAAAVAVIVCAAVAWRSRSWLPVATVAIGLAGFALVVTVVKLEGGSRAPTPAVRGDGGRWLFVSLWARPGRHDRDVDLVVDHRALVDPLVEWPNRGVDDSDRDHRWCRLLASLFGSALLQ